MSTTRRDFCSLCLSTLATGALLPSLPSAVRAQPPDADDAAIEVPPQRTLTTLFNFIATVPAVVGGVKSVEVWIPLPSDDAFQSIRGLSVSTPYPYQITHEERFGNRMAYLKVDAVHTPLLVDVSFVAIRKPCLTAVKEATTITKSAVTEERALQRDRLVPVGGRYTELARAIVAGQSESLVQMRALYDHVVKKIEYDVRHESRAFGQGDAAFVASFKKGNDTDLHSYLIALARSLGIPCYLEFGYPVETIPFQQPPVSNGSSPVAHCWVWFHDAKRGWLPLDAADGRQWADLYHPTVTEYLFGNLLTERATVAVSRGRDLILEPAQRDAPLNFFAAPYAEADGVPVTVDWNVHYTRPQIPPANPPAGKTA